MDPTTLLIVIVTTVIALGGVIVALLLAAGIAWWFMSRGEKIDPPPPPAEDAPPPEADAVAPTPPPAPDVAPPPDPTAPPPSALDAFQMDFDEGDDEVAPTVRLRRPANVRNPVQPALPVEWDDEQSDDALPTELFQVGMKSGAHSAVEGDATEVFSMHAHGEFLLEEPDTATDPGLVRPARASDTEEP